MQIDSEENKKLYWDGFPNYLIRLWMYTLRGLDIFNQARYLIMAIIAVYFMMKLNNILFIPLMFVVCVPILCVAGWVQTHKIAKVIDWLNVKFSTHYSMHQINLLERIADALDKQPEEKK